jgi:hypothetical protein
LLFSGAGGGEQQPEERDRSWDNVTTSSLSTLCDPDGRLSCEITNTKIWEMSILIIVLTMLLLLRMSVAPQHVIFQSSKPKIVVAEEAEPTLKREHHYCNTSKEFQSEVRIFFFSFFFSNLFSIYLPFKNFSPKNKRTGTKYKKNKSQGSDQEG